MDHQNGSKPRELLITKERWEELKSRPQEAEEPVASIEKTEEAQQEETMQNTED